MEADRRPSDTVPQSRLRTWLPVLGFWRGREALTADVLAGITVGLVLVPQAMAYAALAGVPPQHGLYAASFACMVGAMFGRCAQLQTGPVAMTSLIAFAAVTPLAAQGSDSYLALMAILAIMVGAMRILLGLLRGAALVALISKPVLAGFATAAGLTIAATQFPKLFMVDPGLPNPIFNSLVILTRIGEAHLPTLAMGFGTLAVMILFKRFLPRWPGLLIGLAGAGLASWLLDFEALGGRVVGDLPAGLPPLHLPSEGWGMVPDLLGGAALVVVIGLFEVMTVTSTVERRLGVRTDLNGELVGQGMASLTAGATAGFPVSGSLSRSSLNLLAGARTGLSSVVSGALVLLTLLVLTPLLAPLPHAALAAAIVMAVTALVRPLDLVTAWQIKRSDALAGLVAMLVTIAAAPDMVLGMACGIGVSVAYVLWRGMRPRIIIEAPDGTGRRPAAPDQDDPTPSLQDGRLVVRIDSRVTHLNARLLGDRLGAWIGRCPPTVTLVVDACAINDIDTTGCDVLAEIGERLRAHGGRLLLADVKRPVRRRIEACPALREVPLIPTVDAPVPESDPSIAEGAGEPAPAGRD